MHKTTARVTNRKLHCNALLKSKIGTIPLGDRLVLSAEGNSILGTLLLRVKWHCKVFIATETVNGYHCNIY